MVNFMEYWENTREEINAYLKNCLQHPTPCPPQLQEAVEYSVLGGGKRLRPLLALSVCRACKGKDTNVFPVAAAIEMIHCYSLVHDDLPAMDNDDYRRGRLTTHKKFGEAIAILVGDALLTHAFWIIATQTEDKEIVPSLVESVAWAAGLGGMVSGQLMDILGETKEPTAEIVEFIHQHKTGALITAACKCGAIAAKVNEKELKSIVEYGNKIGLAFQIIDDILDITSTTEKLGKTAGKDITQNKITYPRVWGLEQAKATAHQLIQEACEAVEIIPDNSHLLSIAKFILSRES